MHLVASLLSALYPSISVPSARAVVPCPCPAVEDRTAGGTYARSLWAQGAPWLPSLHMELVDRAAAHEASSGVEEDRESLRVLQRSVQWDSLQDSRLITDKEAQLIRRYDKRDPLTQAGYLEQVRSIVQASDRWPSRDQLPTPTRFMSFCCSSSSIWYAMALLLACGNGSSCRRMVRRMPMRGSAC